MDSNKLSELMQGIGVFTELWTITYNGFRNQGLSDAEAMAHTKGFMAALIDSAMREAK